MSLYLRVNVIVVLGILFSKGDEEFLAEDELILGFWVFHNLRSLLKLINNRTYFKQAFKDTGLQDN